MAGITEAPAETARCESEAVLALGLLLDAEAGE